MTVLTSVRVVSTSSEVAPTSTFSATAPGVNAKSSSAACPTCRTTFLLCLLNPLYSTETVYSPAGNAGIVYSPLSELCAVLTNPVAELVIVTVALPTLPPEVSRILPKSVALMACPFVAGAEIQIRTSRHTARHAKDGVIRFITITPGQQNPNRMCWSIAEAVVADVRSYVTLLAAVGPISPGAAALRHENRETHPGN